MPKTRFTSRARVVGALSVLALAVCAFVVAAQARGANTLTVCPSGCTYSSVQTAINHAASGDTITVAAGTYVEPGLYDTDPTTNSNTNVSGLTIVGVGSGSDPSTSTILDASGPPSSSFSHTYGFYIKGLDGITLRNFRLIGPGSGTGQTGYGLKLEADTNISVNNVTVVNSRRSNIDLNGVSGATFTNVTATGAVNGNGLGISDSSNVTINGITTSGNAWGGIALYANGGFYSCGVNAVSVANASLSEVGAIYTGIDHASSSHGGTCAITNITVPTSTLPYKVLLNGPKAQLATRRTSTSRRSPTRRRRRERTRAQRARFSTRPRATTPCTSRQASSSRTR